MSDAIKTKKCLGINKICLNFSHLGLAKYFFSVKTI